VPTGGVQARLDHLVFAASTLNAGVRWLEEQLGVTMGAGGEHAYFGTHNAVLPIQNGYIEMIAVNPAAPAVPHPRWFALDTSEMQHRLAAGPALIHWVVTVPDLELALRLSPEAHGQALALSRGGNRWQLSVPQGGSLPMGGVLPSLIQWESLSPAGLPSTQIGLTCLSLSTPDPARLQAAMDALGFIGVPVEIEAGPPRLKATLEVEGRVVEF
jgi:Glyoxalase-like domain